MYVLAIDPGTCLGWATFDGSHYLSGVVNLGRAAEKGIERDIARCHRLSDFLAEFTPGRDRCVSLLAIEGAAGHAYRQAAKVASHLEGVALAWAGHWQIPAVRVAPAQLKKWATGSGRATKAEMTDAAARLTGCVVLDHNEADALCICAWTVAELKRRRAIS